MSSTMGESNGGIVIGESTPLVHTLTRETVLGVLGNSVDCANLLSDVTEEVRRARYGFLATDPAESGGIGAENDLSPEMIRNFARMMVWRQNRAVNLVVASQSTLHLITSTGSARSLNFCVAGPSSAFLLGFLDENYRDGMSEDEGETLIKRCHHEINRRWGGGGGGGEGGKRQLTFIDAEKGILKKVVPV